MNQLGLISITASLMASLFCACSDDSVPNASVVPAPSDVSSSSLVNSSSSVIVSSSSSFETVTSSSLSTFSKFLAQFSASSEKAFAYDSHVVAYNTNLSVKCKDAMVSYDEDGTSIPLKSISEEYIAECFPKTAPLIKDKFSSDVKFYAVFIDMVESPIIFVLNKFSSDEIVVQYMYPGNSCHLMTSGPTVMFLVADTIVVNMEKNLIKGYKIETGSWNCDETGTLPKDVQPYGEWYSDSLL